MKKIYYGILIVFFSLLGIFVATRVGDFQINSILSSKYDGGIYISADEMADGDTVIKEIESLAKKEGFSLVRPMWTYEKGNSILSVYILNVKDDVLKGFEIKSSKGLAELKDGEYITNGDTSQKGAVGTIKLYQKEREIRLRSFSELKKVGINGIYNIRSKDDDYAKDIKKIASIQGISKVTKEDKIMVFGQMDIFSIYISIAFILFLLLVTMSLFTYNINRLSRERSIKRLFGESRGRIFLSNILSEIMVPLVSTGLIGIVISIGFYRVFMGFFPAMDLILLLILAIGLSLLVMMVIMMIGLVINSLRKIRLVNSIKGEEKRSIIHIYVIKTVMVAVGIFVLAYSFNGLRLYYNQHSKLDNLEKMKDLGIISAGLTRDNAIDSLEEYQKFAILWDSIDDQGGIMFMDDSSSVNDNNNQRPAWRGRPVWERNLSLINNNYLKENQVVDKDGKRLMDFPEDTKVAYVLIPEKFRNIEDYIKKATLKQHIFQYGIINENYIAAKAKAEGKPNPNINDKDEDITNDNTLKRNPELDVKLIYIKDGQKLFKYSARETDFVANEDQFVTDSILMVATKGNSGEYTKQYSICNKDMKYRFTEPKNPTGKMEEEIQKVGLFKNVMGISSVEDLLKVEKDRMKGIFTNSLAIAILSLMIVVVANLHCIFVYLGNNTKKLAVKKMFGESFLERNKAFLLINLLSFTVAIAAGLTQFNNIFQEDELRKIGLFFFVISIVLVAILEVILIIYHLKKEEKTSIVMKLKE